MPGYAKPPGFNSNNISITPTGNISSTVLQDGIEELDSDFNVGLSGKAPIASPSFTGTALVVSPTSAGSRGVRNITMSTSTPTGGSDGDVWLVYS
jgi:hypothetical protein